MRRDDESGRCLGHGWVDSGPLEGHLNMCVPTSLRSGLSAQERQPRRLAFAEASLGLNRLQKERSGLTGGVEALARAGTSGDLCTCCRTGVLVGSVLVRVT